MDDIEILKKRLEREIKAREILEREIEDKTHALFSLLDYNQKLFDAIPLYIFITDLDGNIKSTNNYTSAELLNHKINVKNIKEIVSFETIKNNHGKIGNSEVVGVIDLVDKKIYINGAFCEIKNSSDQKEILYCFKDLDDVLQKENEIKKLKEQLIDSSYRDGVAETAVSVLHNVGNILTTIIGLSDQTQSLKELALGNMVFEKLRNELLPFKDQNRILEYFKDDKKSFQFFGLIDKLLSSYKSTEKDIYQKFQTIREKANHINQVIVAQQKFANFTEKKKEKIKIKEIINQCLMIRKEKLESSKIKVELDIDFNHSIYSSRVGLAQVLINLLSNAEESMNDRQSSDPYYAEKCLKIKSYTENNSSYLVLEDNGAGISDENLKKLFKFGFSTKNRNSGFGLHNCANYIKAEGGKLEVKSNGINQGAQIILQFPNLEVSL